MKVFAVAIVSTFAQTAFRSRVLPYRAESFGQTKYANF